jgi:hypothetical protein
MLLLRLRGVLLVYGSLVYEMYRVVGGSFFTLTVPQRCKGHKCYFWEEVHPLTISFVLMNTVTFGVLAWWYYVELQRETYLIRNFSQETNEPRKIEVMCSPGESNNVILLRLIHSKYIRISRYAFGFFVVNNLFMTYMLISRYLDRTSLIVFVNGVVLLSTKFCRIYPLTIREDGMFMSTVLRQRQVFSPPDVPVAV